MNKAIFTIMLMLSFSLTGCIEDESTDLQPVPVIEPTGASDMDSLERRISALENETEDLRYDNDKLGNRIVDLEADNSELSNAYNRLLRDYDNLTGKLVILQEDLDNLEQQGGDSSELLAEIELLEAKISDLEIDVEVLMNDKNSLYNKLYLLRDISPGSTRFVDHDFLSECISGCSLLVDQWGEGRYLTHTEIGIYKHLIFFGATSSGSPGNANNHNLTLWISDGTPFGTFELSSSYYSPENFIAVNNGIFFTAYDERDGTELRFSDGSIEGTSSVTNDGHKCDSSNAYNLIGTNGDALYFSQMVWSNGCYGSYQGYNLYRAVVSSEGEISVNKLNGEPLKLDHSESFFSGSNFFFTVNDNEADTVGLYVTHGESINLVKEFDDSPDNEASFGEFGNIGDILYFSYGELGNESLWQSDGTEEGTYLFKSFHNNSDDSTYISQIFSVGNKLYLKVFVIGADEMSRSANLYVSDGTEEGTRVAMVGDIYGRDSYMFHNDEATETLYLSMSNFQSKLFFYQINTTHDSFDLLFNKTVLSLDFGESIMVDGNIYLRGEDPNTGMELWKIDIDMEYIGLLHDINNGLSWSGINSFTYLNSKIFFSAYTSSHGSEIWYITV